MRKTTLFTLAILLLALTILATWHVAPPPDAGAQDGPRDCYLFVRWWSPFCRCWVERMVWWPCDRPPWDDYGGNSTWPNR